MTKTPATFLWHELLTKGAKASETFYRRVIGWEAKDSGLPGPPYTIISANGIPENGAKLLMGPHEVPTGSWIAHLRDPQGATLAIVAPKR